MMNQDMNATEKIKELIKQNDMIDNDLNDVLIDIYQSCNDKEKRLFNDIILGLTGIKFDVILKRLGIPSKE